MIGALVRATAVTVHNYRSIEHADFLLNEVSLVAGANNSGKSNFVDAIRTFYGDLKWDADRDAPKFSPSDGDSWIELEFMPSPEELLQLKEEYRSDAGTFRVRNYFIATALGSDGKPRAGYYAYVDGRLSDTLFYGAKNVGSGKFGKIIYIPAVSRVEEHTKMSGPSALRELITTVLSNVIAGSPTYADLTSAFGDFEREIRTQQSSEGHSLRKLEHEISTELAGWGTGFQFEVQGIQPDDLIKTLVKPVFVDQEHGGAVDQLRFGAGFQRSLIYSLIKLAARYARPARRDSERRDFSPVLNWIIFEEPEAFLHPTQEDVLFEGLRQIAQEEGNQVLLTTHSSRFVSRAMSDLGNLIRLRRTHGRSTAFQLLPGQLDDLFEVATAISAEFEVAGISVSEDDKQSVMSALKYELWLNPYRAAAFFASHVLLTEGPSEVALISYFTSRRIFEPPQGLVVVDCIGKYNLHRFMTLLTAFGVDHSVLYDGDGGKPEDMAVTASIERCRSIYTHEIHQFSKDLEHFLGLPRCAQKHRKPQHLLYHLETGALDSERLHEAVSLVRRLSTATGAAIVLPETERSSAGEVGPSLTPTGQSASPPPTGAARC